MIRIEVKWFCLAAFLSVFLFCQTKPVRTKRDNGYMVFLSDRESPRREFDIWRMNPDGSAQMNLTSGIEGIRSFSAPVVSPDGHEILYVALMGGRRSLCKVLMDGTDAGELTELNVDIPDAAYSPDGERIVFVDKPGQNRQIFIMNSDGSGRRNISNNEMDEKDPAFSPDGERIVFSAKSGSSYSICLMNADGSGRKRLTDDRMDDENPSFSPAGLSIVFTATLKGNSDVCTMDLGTRRVQNLYRSPTHELDPRYAPDGRRILFISNSRGIKYRDLFVFDIRTEKVQNLTFDLNYVNQNAAFLSNDRIVFESVQFNNSEIYAVDPGKGGPVNISNHPKWDCCPAY